MSRAEFVEETEALLGAMRQWLFALEEDTAGGDLAGADGDSAPVDVHTLAGELTALRGEVRLESRGSKASRETMQRASEAFTAGLDTVREAVDARAEEASSLADSLERTLVPLVEERDGLRDDVRRLREAPLEGAHEALVDAVDTLRRCRRATERAHRALGWRRLLFPQAVFDGLLDGYCMAERRVEDALRRLGVTEIDAVERDFDPHSMRSVETQARDDVSPGRVLEVVRSGYRRGEQVLRAADVRVAVAPGSVGGEEIVGEQAAETETGA